MREQVTLCIQNTDLITFHLANCYGATLPKLALARCVVMTAETVNKPSIAYSLAFSKTGVQTRNQTRVMHFWNFWEVLK